VIAGKGFAVAGVSRGGYLARGVLAKRSADVNGVLLITPATRGAAPAESLEFSFDVDQLPSLFDKPVLILAGRQESVVGYLDAWKTLAQFPRATFAVLDRAGHYLPTEQHERLLALAGEWLRRVRNRAADRLCMAAAICWTSYAGVWAT